MEIREKHPHEIAGSALGARLAYQVDMESILRARPPGDYMGMSDAIKAGGDVDTVNSPKFSTPGGFTKHMLGGAISANVDVGEFKFAWDSLKKTFGSFQLNQAKSEMFSSAATTKLGSTEIKTLLGSQMNAAGVKLPSSSITPQKTWLKTLFPTFSVMNVAEFMMLVAAGQLLKSIDKKYRDRTTVSSSRKNLGDIIVDNQDFELAILNGTI